MFSLLSARPAILEMFGQLQTQFWRTWVHRKLFTVAFQVQFLFLKQIRFRLTKIKFFPLSSNSSKQYSSCKQYGLPFRNDCLDFVGYSTILFISYYEIIILASITILNLFFLLTTNQKLSLYLTIFVPHESFSRNPRGMRTLGCELLATI